MFVLASSNAACVLSTVMRVYKQEASTVTPSSRASLSKPAPPIASRAIVNADESYSTIKRMKSTLFSSTRKLKIFEASFACWQHQPRFQGSFSVVEVLLVPLARASTISKRISRLYCAVWVVISLNKCVSVFKP